MRLTTKKRSYTLSLHNHFLLISRYHKVNVSFAISYWVAKRVNNTIKEIMKFYDNFFAFIDFNVKDFWWPIII